MALDISRRGESFDVSNLSNTEVAEISGLRYLTDAWKEPLSFDHSILNTSIEPPVVTVSSGGPDNKLSTASDNIISNALN